MTNSVAESQSSLSLFCFLREKQSLLQRSCFGCLKH